MVGKMATALVNQGLPDISVKLPDPKAFHGDHKQSKAWLSKVCRYFIVVVLAKDEWAHSIQMTNICCALVQGNAAQWMYYLEML